MHAPQLRHLREGRGIAASGRLLGCGPTMGRPTAGGRQKCLFPPWPRRVSAGGRYGGATCQYCTVPSSWAPRPRIHMPARTPSPHTPEPTLVSTCPLDKYVQLYRYCDRELALARAPSSQHAMPHHGYDLALEDTLLMQAPRVELQIVAGSSGHRRRRKKRRRPRATPQPVSCGGLHEYLLVVPVPPPTTSPGGGPRARPRPPIG